jgi:hypothetical protein
MIPIVDGVFLAVIAGNGVWGLRPQPPEALEVDKA